MGAGAGAGAPAGDRGDKIHGVVTATILDRGFVDSTWYILSRERQFKKRKEKAAKMIARRPVDMKLSLRGLPRGDGSRAPHSLTSLSLRLIRP